MSRALPFVLLFSVLTLGGCSSLSSLNRDTTAVTGLDSKEAKEALRLARVLRDNSRLPGAYEIYERMDQRQQLSGSYLLEYASVAAAELRSALARHDDDQDRSRSDLLEAEARIKDELNRQIIASSPDCTKVLDLEGRVVQMTEQGCRLVEVDDFEEVRLSDWTTWWPDEGGTLARDAVAAARQGKGSRFVAFGNTFKGTPKWWDTMISPICDAQGQPVLLLAVSRDITELHQQQDEIRRFNAELEKRVKERTEELAEAKERVSMSLAEAQSLYNQAPCGYHSFDANGTLVLINRTELDWLGYERHEVIGKLNVRDMVPPGDGNQELVLERLNRLVAGEKLDPIETVVRRRDGSTFSALVSSTAVRDSKGRFLRSNNTLIDITALKAAQQALAAQSRFMQTISDNAPVQIAFFDRDLICRFANASYARWLDTTPERLLGLHLSDIARPQDYQTNLPLLQAALAGEPQHLEGERQLPGGPPFVADIAYTPYTVAGQVQGLIVQIVDGYLIMPDRPGWGTEPNEEAIKAHPPKGQGGLLNYGQKK